MRTLHNANFGLPLAYRLNSAVCHQIRSGPQIAKRFDMWAWIDVPSEFRFVKTSEVLYDWNWLHQPRLQTRGAVLVNDETLRDGLQSPSTRVPCIEQKIDVLHRMEALGIHSANLGLPGAGTRAAADVEALARVLANGGLKILPNCSARTHTDDIRAVAEISQKTGLKIEVGVFLGSSPIRCYVEGWTQDFLLRTTESAVHYAESAGLDVAFVTEDTTRCDPAMIRRLYSTALNFGAKALVICDTVGHATPMGAYTLIHFLQRDVVQPAGGHIRLDWHGHRDRGLALANSLAAILAGADCVHACALGLGERTGNTEMELLLLNLKLLGFPPWPERDLASLPDYCLAVSQATGREIPENHLVVGKNALRMASAALVEALEPCAERNSDPFEQNYSRLAAPAAGHEESPSL
jgi:isopropylmalate/homocitrate/citramalate synthase